MGLFSFAVKIGIIAYAIDWVHDKRRSYYGYSSQRSIENVANDALTSVEEATPRMRQWLHAAWSSNTSCHSWSRHHFHSHSSSPDISTTHLPNGRTSLEIDLPGVDKSNVTLTVNEHEKVVIVKGTAAANDAEGRRERLVEARFSLPRTADVGDVNAKMENGVRKSGRATMTQEDIVKAT
ncbi:hypothetical protein HDU98_006450 [Podochytrium sp. JEL0797]|nr:hypothetical protein HDU98_006450 [Podochytrium sp. JEL0797]